MPITRGRSPYFFEGSSSIVAIIICLIAITERTSAREYENICARGDMYEVTGHGTCALCTNWCKSECSRMGSSSVVEDKCAPTLVPGAVGFECFCCCKNIRPLSTPPPPPSPPSSSKSPPSPPSSPSPPPPPNFAKNICPQDQTYMEIFHTNSGDCALKPLCAAKCAEIGASSERTECMGNAHNTGNGRALKWYEQCCCKPLPPTPPPSPPLPSSFPPPPPPPCTCPSPPPPSCQVEIKFQISPPTPGQEPCMYTCTLSRPSPQSSSP
ncbi:formin-like protein 14 [Papaver somniferum]|uniref:formin-like protein 14 n=1 Tax=Papaver somniferum TaxID=3469 RepID=UPI000E6F9505|nr:formin-like protein 14 [Papaver somniferum]